MTDWELKNSQGLYPKHYKSSQAIVGVLHGPGIKWSSVLNATTDQAEPPKKLVSHKQAIKDTQHSSLCAMFLPARRMTDFKKTVARQVVFATV